MPICPKCGKLISDKKYRRHIDRCGQTHRHKSRPLGKGDDFYMRL